MVYLILFLSGLISILILTPYLINFLLKINVVDIPGGRKIHDGLVPRLGGILIYFIVSFLLLTFYNDLNTIRFVIIGSFILAACGFIDDCLGMAWKYKLIIQVVISMYVIYHFLTAIHKITIFEVVLPFPLNYIILFLFILGTINALNLMDGLDGLVSQFSFSIFALNFVLGFMLNNVFIMFISITFSGALLGFMIYNAYPARIFLGDGGSLTLGFFLVVTCIELSLTKYSGNLNLTPALFTLALPVVDTIRVATIRIINKKSPFLPDQNHLHHQILKSGIKHESTVMILQAISLIFLFAALFYFRENYLMAYILFAVGLFVVFSISPVIKLIQKVWLKFNKKILGALNAPVKVIPIMDKLLPILSIVAFSMVLITSTPLKTPFSHNILLLLLLFEILMLFVAFYHYRINHNFNYFYIFINLLLLFSLDKIQSVGGMSYFYQPHLFESKLLYYASIMVVTGLVMLYLISRKVVLAKTKVFFTGIDLYLIVLGVLAFILKSIFKNPVIDTLNSCLMLSIIFTMLAKIVMVKYQHRSQLLFYLSFGVTISVLWLMMTYK